MQTKWSRWSEGRQLQKIQGALSNFGSNSSSHSCHLSRVTKCFTSSVRRGQSLLCPLLNSKRFLIARVPFLPTHSGIPETFPQGGKPKAKVEGKSVKSEENLPRTRKKGVAIKCWRQARILEFHTDCETRKLHVERKGLSKIQKEEVFVCQALKNKRLSRLVHHRANGVVCLQSCHGGANLALNSKHIVKSYHLVTGGIHEQRVNQSSRHRVLH